LIYDSISHKDFHSALTNLNEKQDSRKSNGIYYTPADVTEFITVNSMAIHNKREKRLYTDFSEWYHNDKHSQIKDNLLDKTVFDPTCGTGEFLMQAITFKLNMLGESPTTEEVISVFSTIYGNDIDNTAIDICKIRIFFECIKRIGTEYCDIIVNILNKNFTTLDFINILDGSFDHKYDIIIGNPPYVEDSKSDITPHTKYGNIYANVLKNSIDLLSPDGVMGFIIPISYISTERMTKIRSYIEKNTAEQYILSYADRPSCLFTGVHQKLSILITRKGKETHTVYTSNYKHWYKEERDTIFNDVQIIENPLITKEYYPKLSNSLEISIYKKIHTQGFDNLLSHLVSSGNSIFVNMRACFWIKAFDTPQSSKEYKSFSCDPELKHALTAILNSSLFYFHWICISDCWHITTKDLASFRFPFNKHNKDHMYIINNLNTLTQRLMTELQLTKIEINTVQTTHEYKHKLCKYIIDEIDDALAIAYGLTPQECEYIKGYCSKYRESRGCAI